MTFEELHREAKHLIAIAQSCSLDQRDITREVIDILAQLYFGAKQEVYKEWKDSVSAKITNLDNYKK
jgi:hypothetical protein